MRNKDEREAVFWCGLLRPLLFGEIEKGSVAAWLRKTAAEEVCFPDGRKRKPSLATLKRKLRQYRKGGFAALPRQRRNDRGKARAAPEMVLQTAIEAKREQPRRSARTLNLLLETRHGKTVARSTLYRHLQSAGATRLKLGVVQDPVRKRWTYEHSNDGWTGDFAAGPCVLVQGLAVRTHLSAFIDVHSRYVVAARYYLRESMDVLCDTLIRALTVHGVPLVLYLDNAKVYHAHSLNALCDRLHIRLLHRPPRDPAPGGLIERFIQTAQGQFESEVRAGDILTLEKLNEAFLAWLEVGYHLQSHSETGQTPSERFERGASAPRIADLQAVAESFLQREKRSVDKTFSDVRLHGRHYRVNEKLRGDRLEVRYDPFGSHEKVWLYSRQGEFIGEGFLHHRQDGQRPVPLLTPSSRTNLLDILIEKQKRLHLQERGIAFNQSLTPQRWPFAAFAACLAELLGRPGGITAFSADELAALRQVHDRQPGMHRTHLKKAFLQAGRKSIPAVIYALQNHPHEEK